MRRFACLSFILFAIVSVASAQKKRVAVMNFDYATVHSSVLSIWGADNDIGKGIADLLVDSAAIRRRLGRFFKDSPQEHAVFIRQLAIDIP